MYEKYRNFLNKYITLNYLEWKLFQSRIKVVVFEKGDIIHSMGAVSNKLLFINSGLARAYIIDEKGKDYTWSIFFNDDKSNMINLFVVDYESFCTQNHSRVEIEALEDCEVFVLEHKDVTFLYDKLKKFEKLGRLMGEEGYRYLHNLMIDRRTKNAKERFEDFMKETPYLLERVPQYHIATLLDITPQHLSRLKKSENESINIDE